MFQCVGFSKSTRLAMSKPGKDGKGVDELMMFVCFIELDDGKIYRKPLDLMVKTMVSG